MFDIYWYDYDDCTDIQQLKASALATANTEFVWLLHRAVDYTNFDLRFIPHRHQTKFNHAWPSHNNPECYTTWLLTADSSCNHFYDTLLPVTRAASGLWQWHTDQEVSYQGFDFDWFPGIYDWDQDHEFAMAGTQQLSYTKLSRGSKIKKYHKSNLCLKYIPIYYDTDTIPEDVRWAWLADNRVDYTGWDWSWLPDAWDQYSTQAFCLAGTESLSYTRLVNRDGLNHTIYRKSHLKFKADVTPVLYWQDHSNQIPNYHTACELAQGREWTWIADKRIPYDDAAFDWLPDAWDTRYIHCFTLKDKQQLSYTWLIHQDAITDFAGYKYYNTQQQLQDHVNVCNLDTGLRPHTADYNVKLITTMQQSIRNAVNKAEQEWLWIIADCCDYTGFDFLWLPDLDQRHQVHCWPSGDCEKGDTFLIHVPSFDPDKIKFNFDHSSVKRKPWPVVSYDKDSLSEALIKRDHALYSLFVPSGLSVPEQPIVCLWEKRPVMALNKSHSISLVPRDCVCATEIYQYPYLLKQYCAPDEKTDVIFISNGEPDADANYQRLLSICPDAKLLTGVNGRLAAYKAASSMSTTPWFIAVFAKCQVLPSLVEMNWTPDYWQEPKHYIFHNRNLNTGLTYGHMAPIAYNVRLMLDNRGGLDITLAQKHTVVPEVVSETMLTDPVISWRTAFREVIKLLDANISEISIESQYRLHQWQHNAMGSDADWQLMGAADAIEYYGSLVYHDELLKTVEWRWLDEYFSQRHSADLTTLTTVSTSVSLRCQ
jgi:hypothetical protein